MGLYGLKEDARYQCWRIEAEDLGTRGWVEVEWIVALRLAELSS